MNSTALDSHTSWEWLLALFTFDSLAETIFYGQITSFKPLDLPNLKVPTQDIAR